MDSKVFRGYHFNRDVSDDASGGRNAVYLPDALANEALKHRDVFMQWDHPVPQHIKDLRLQRPQALLKDAKANVKHWLKRLAAAEILPEDNPRQVAIKQGEIDGAQAQIDYYEEQAAKARAEADKVARENGHVDTGRVAAEATPAAAIHQETLELLAQMRAALLDSHAANQQLRNELLTLRDQLERDGRVSRDEPIAPPSVAPVGLGADSTGATEIIVTTGPGAGEEVDPDADLKAEGYEEIGDEEEGEAKEGEAEQEQTGAPATPEPPATVRRRRQQPEG
jgi:hypothetical protein